MAAAQWPVSLKPISKYLARAKEVETASPVVAYYCKVVALQEGFKCRDTSDPAATQFLTSLLDNCELAKKSLGGEKDSHQAEVESFALEVFQRADDEDRAGSATKDTAKTFYAAVCFLEVTRFFNDPLPSDMDEKLKYAKWKVADITRAIREGRTPTPGAPGESLPAAPEPYASQSSGASAAHSHHEQPAYPGYGGVGAADEGMASRASAGPAAAYPEYPTQGPPGSAPYGSGPSVAAPTYPTSADPAALYGAPRPYASGGSDGATPAEPAYPAYPSATNEMPSYPAYTPTYTSAYQPSAPPGEEPQIPSPGYDSATHTAGEETEKLRGGERRPVSHKPGAADPVPTGPTPLSQQGNKTEPYVSAESYRAPPQVADAMANGAQEQARKAVSYAAPAAMVGPPPVGNFTPDFKMTSMAQKSAKNAASALDFQDVRTAIAELQKALNALTGRQPQ
mmetsp:Transcript_16172/g.39879  ORF Transcript_16172/g.39879 Transcript_16172/m.39879 type:complete len:453 (+) Transcript_16172:54-1412(+)